ncbi:phasin family protein [Natronocella acetinitrilica]|jgi:phasin family protein|uniref:Phasin family protein n=1 Tax=Natronocella acetinitrilica TaxID=414046 RepID=A0AAE3KC28_9GAMM|nr:phasin family protein [Natronocella acetinitrilica]MCP1675289.1 phasin family protein [Natronocella acetinitrilica]
MNNVNLEQFNKQFEALFVAPARAYSTLALDHAEQLLNAQYDATKAYADAGLSHVRAMLDIKDPQGLRSYVESQQKVAKDLGERLKGDAEKVVALNQEFVQKAQQLAETNAKNVTSIAK